MKKIDLNTTREFTEGGMKRFFLVEDSPYFKIINFNLAAGATFPVAPPNQGQAVAQPWR